MLDLTSLTLAIRSLEQAVLVIENADLMADQSESVREVLQAGVIQNFEFTYELCYKFMVRWLSLNISPDHSGPITKREVFRNAARHGLIEDPARWFRYTDARNETSHTYDQQTAGRVLSLVPSFMSDARMFYAAISRMND